MAHTGLLLPTSSTLWAICHWESGDEFFWLPLPLSPKNLIRSAKDSNHFLSCLDCIYRSSAVLHSPNQVFHNYSPLIIVYLYTPCTVCSLPVSEEKFMEVRRESLREKSENYCQPFVLEISHLPPLYSWGHCVLPHIEKL